MLQLTPLKSLLGFEYSKYWDNLSLQEYELRQYAQSDWVYTDLQNIEYKGAIYEMFMRLYRYISGANTERKS